MRVLSRAGEPAADGAGARRVTLRGCSRGVGGCRASHGDAAAGTRRPAGPAVPATTSSFGRGRCCLSGQSGWGEGRGGAGAQVLAARARGHVRGHGWQRDGGQGGQQQRAAVQGTVGRRVGGLLGHDRRRLAVGGSAGPVATQPGQEQRAQKDAGHQGRRQRRGPPAIDCARRHVYHRYSIRQWAARGNSASRRCPLWLVVVGSDVFVRDFVGRWGLCLGSDAYHTRLALGPAVPAVRDAAVCHLTGRLGCCMLHLH